MKNSTDISPQQDDFRRGRLPWQAKIALKAKEIVKTIIDAGGAMRMNDVYARCEGEYFDAALSLALRHKAIGGYIPESGRLNIVFHTGKKQNETKKQFIGRIMATASSQRVEGGGNPA